MRERMKQEFGYPGQYAWGDELAQRGEKCFLSEEKGAEGADFFRKYSSIMVYWNFSE